LGFLGAFEALLAEPLELLRRGLVEGDQVGQRAGRDLLRIGRGQIGGHVGLQFGEEHHTLGLADRAFVEVLDVDQGSPTAHREAETAKAHRG